MHPLREVAAGADIAADRIEVVGGRLHDVAVLGRQPVVVVGQVIGARQQRAHLPLDVLHAERRVQPHELGDVRADLGARQDVAEERLRRHLAAVLRALEVVAERVELGAAAAAAAGWWL